MRAARQKSDGNARFVRDVAIAKRREREARADSSELCGHQAAALGRFRELMPNRCFDFARLGRSLRLDVSMQLKQRRAKRAIVVLQRRNVEVLVRRLCELKYPPPQCWVIHRRRGLAEQLAKTIVLLDTPAGAAIPLFAYDREQGRYHADSSLVIARTNRGNHALDQVYRHCLENAFYPRSHPSFPISSSAARSWLFINAHELRTRIGSLFAPVSHACALETQIP